ncbi:hypothetical protein FNO01nite_14100 [Flavobacterium noncentrifugens]|nr:hypothetical protein FNO01nite_14100 [Flavobacterium noncentrifugens]
MSVDRVAFIIGNIEDFYREKSEKKIDKKTGDFKCYKDGTLKIRTIHPSQGELKLAQQRLKNRFFAGIPLPHNVHGGIRKKSNITNSKTHQGNKYILATDLQEFYPSISSKMVYDCLLSLGNNSHVASQITKLVTYRHKVPQGAPTSTHVSNVVFLKTDLLLIDFCKKHGITYTRYVDDLTFSSQQDFRHLIAQILGIVLSGGFKLSFRKTLYSNEQTITGIEVFLNKIDAPLKIIERALTEIDMPIKPVTNYLESIRRTNNKIWR